MYNVVLSNASVISTHPLHTYVKNATAGVSLIRWKRRRGEKKRILPIYMFVCHQCSNINIHFFFRGSLIMILVKSIDNDTIAYIKLSNITTHCCSVCEREFLSSSNCIACCYYYSFCCWYFIGRNARACAYIHIEECVGKKQ
jgi:hypothetical protein